MVQWCRRFLFHYSPSFPEHSPSMSPSPLCQPRQLCRSGKPEKPQRNRQCRVSSHICVQLNSVYKHFTGKGKVYETMVLPGLKPGLSDSESDVLTTTQQNLVVANPSPQTHAAMVHEDQLPFSSPPPWVLLFLLCPILGVLRALCVRSSCSSVCGGVCGGAASPVWLRGIVSSGPSLATGEV